MGMRSHFMPHLFEKPADPLQMLCLPSLTAREWIHHAVLTLSDGA
jgi:hypothetical protein